MPNLGHSSWSPDVNGLLAAAMGISSWDTALSPNCPAIDANCVLVISVGSNCGRPRCSSPLPIPLVMIASNSPTVKVALDKTLQPWCGWPRRTPVRRARKSVLFGIHC
ncbi:hypothetical protein F441_09672 [Phytophthora nicotianae CJ01A1]|uniref:Uncharacterized protein n=3 Tax=Phytophthora nicotianae TaxID=4792 RepID=V9F3Y6_PHYNI|nr:hypothetical protein F443_09739 [Phytophthora nicotianae P1569]ETK85753.1 hypothetical protein L915_09531 [Phytophthora nicotianae]ETP15641.1 hypothetical protein F441_09672 [Phytophthora nicotianae CJ01A1]